MKVDAARLEQLRQLLVKESQASEIKTTSEYEAFRIAFTDGLVIAYKTGKIVVNGESCRDLLAKVLERMGLEETRYDFIIGSDEAGKGEWLGPMVVAAVALTSKQSGVLRSLGVMDSKALSPKKIGELKEQILGNAAAVKTVLVSPKTFNERIEELHDEGKSLNDLLAWAHAKVIGEIHSQLKRDHAGMRFEVVIDEFSKLKTQERLSRVLALKEVDVIQRPRAEDEMAVAAASVIARRVRDEWIDRTSKQLGIELLSLTPNDAVRRADRRRLAKIGYLEKLVS